MFDGELVWVRSFEVIERFEGPRLRLRTIVNDEPCFVKTHGDVQRQCVADELKPVFGLRKIGCSWAMVGGRALGLEDVNGVPILIARFHEHEGMLRQAGRPEHVEELARILLFDVWVQNNDRTGNNVLVQGPHLLPIDESAAFKRDATLRLGPTWAALLREGPWCEPDWAVDTARRCACGAPRGAWPLLAEAFGKAWIVDTRWQRVRTTLETRLVHIETLWQQFVAAQLRAKETVHGETAEQTL
jgi:hypothetical protein